MRERVNWEEYAPNECAKFTARASIIQAQVHSWRKASPSLNITYHTAAPFPIRHSKDSIEDLLTFPFTHITFRQTPARTLQSNIGIPDGPEFFHNFTLSRYHTTISSLRYTLIILHRSPLLSTSSQIHSAQYKYLCIFVVFSPVEYTPFTSPSWEAKLGFNWVKTDPFSPIDRYLWLQSKRLIESLLPTSTETYPLGPFEISGANLISYHTVILSKITFSNS